MKRIKIQRAVVVFMMVGAWGQVLGGHASALPEAVQGTGKMVVGDSSVVCTAQTDSWMDNAYGLSYPLISNLEPSWRDRVFRLTSPRATSLLWGEGEFDICGKVTGVAGMGPGCAMSKGFDGVGVVRFPSAGRTLAISDFEWKATVGSVVPVTARVHELDEATGARSHPSRLYGLVAMPDTSLNAETGQGCLYGYDVLGSEQAQGRRHWPTVISVFAMEDVVCGPGSSEAMHPVDPKHDGPSSRTNPWGDKADEQEPAGPWPPDGSCGS